LAHRNDIQGLRAVAVLLVVLSHAGVSFLAGGYVGVDVFFVLSGFLITGVLLSGIAEHGAKSLGDFYMRRAKRILPAAALTIVVTDIVAYYVLNYVRARQAITDSLWASLFGANIEFSRHGTNYFAQGQPPSPFQHYWSLSVEEQFYVVWPALMCLALLSYAAARKIQSSSRVRRAALSHRGLNWLLVVIAVLTTASLVWSIHYTGTNPTASYFSTFTRAWELGLGAALAVGVTERKVASGPIWTAGGWAGLGCIIAASVAYSNSTAFPGWAALLPTVGAALVIAAGVGNRATPLGVGRMLATAPLRYIGDRSYAFYLWHWPVLIIALLYKGHELSVGVKLALMVGAFALSILSYEFFENPIRRARWSRARALWAMEAVAAVMLVAVLGTRAAIDNKVARLSSGPEVAQAALTSEPAHKTPSHHKKAVASNTAAIVDPAPLPAVVAAVKAAQRGDPLPRVLTPAPADLLTSEYFPPSGCAASEVEQTSSKICHLGKPSATRRIVVVGDSHAQQWMPAILALAERDGWDVVPLLKSACAPLEWLGHTGSWENFPAFNVRKCAEWYTWALGQAKGLHPEVTLIGAEFGGIESSPQASAERFSDEFINGMFSFARQMKRASSKVIIMGDTPVIQKQPVDCLLAKHATLASCPMYYPPNDYYASRDIQVAAKRAHIGYIYSKGWFCQGNLCPVVVGNTIVFLDNNHMTKEYAYRLRDLFRSSFLEQMHLARTT
jgi:peptidoglycan/LPS O-acetylase OafA/YrhL